MSIEAMALVLNHSTLSGTDKIILLGIANHEGDGGAWPTIATLARYANVTERTVQRSLQVAVDAGELLIEDQAGGTRETRPDRRPNRYRVLVRCPEGCDGTTQHRVTSASPRSADGVTPVTERGDAHVANGVTPTSPEPSYQPSKNQIMSDASGVDPSTDLVTIDDDPILALCEHLAEWIERNGARRPRVTTTWIRDMERMVRLDGRSEEQIRIAIDWCQSDSFWRANILSPAKLRAKYEQMRLQASRAPRSGAQAVYEERARATGQTVESTRQEALQRLARGSEEIMAARRKR